MTRKHQQRKQLISYVTEKLNALRTTYNVHFDLKINTGGLMQVIGTKGTREVVRHSIASISQPLVNTLLEMTEQSLKSELQTA